MATSGSFETTHRISGSYNTYAVYAWSQSSQSTANNTTTISWSLTGRTASQYQYIHIYSASATTDGSTKSGWSGNMYNNTSMLSGSKTITHADDGTRSFSASATIEMYATGAYYSGSNSWTLTSIPRKATVKTAPNFNDEDNPTITYENKAGNSVSSLDAGIFLDGWTAVVDYRAIPKTGSSYTFDLTTEERNAIRAAMPNANSMTVRFYIQTVIGSNTFLDYKEATVSIVNGNPTFSNFTYADTNSTTTTITGNNQYIIQNKSTLRATITSANKATANKSATMVQYDVNIGSYSGSAAYSTSNINYNIGTVNATTNQTLTISARDSRDNLTSVQKAVNIVPYSSPSIVATATRYANFESNTTIKVSGAMSLLKVAGTTKNAVNASNGVKYRYKQSDSSTWGSWNNIASTTAADGTVSVTDFVRTFDNKKAWNLQFSITDKLETTTINVLLGQGQPQFFIGSDGRTSVGGLPSVALPSGNTGQMEIYGNVYADGSVYAGGKKLMTLDDVYPVGSIFMSMNHTTPEQVAAALGGGTWEAWGAGRFPVGVGEVDDNNDDWCGHTSAGDWTANPNGKGGETYHTLTTSEIPSHQHTIEPRILVWDAGQNGVWNQNTWGRGNIQNYDFSELKTLNAGGGQAHNNMPPYITVYMWKRIA